jgi:hypothetical protein
MALQSIADWTVTGGTVGTDFTIQTTDAVHGYVSLRMEATAVAAAVQSAIVPAEQNRPHKLRVWLKASSNAAGSNVTVTARAIRNGKALGTLFTMIAGVPLSAAATWLLYELELTDALANGYYITISKAAVAFQLSVGLAEVVPCKKSFSAYPSGNQSVNSGAWTKVLFQTEIHDYGSTYTNGATSLFTAPARGLWHFDATVLLDALAADKQHVIAFYVNGAEYRGRAHTRVGSAVSTPSLVLSADILLNKGDNVGVYMLHDHGSARNALAAYNVFSGHELW